MSKASLNRQTILQIAKLSKLSLPEGKVIEMTDQLQKIMGFFDKISALPTDHIEPLLTPTEIEPFWREDESQDLYSSEEMVQNAPSKQGALFKVPPVV